MKYFFYYLCRRWRILFPIVAFALCLACEGEDHLEPDLRDYADMERGVMQTTNIDSSQGR